MFLVGHVEPPFSYWLTTPLPLPLAGAPEVAAPVEALLDVASHPDDSICSMSFNFWHRLSRALTSGLHPQPIGAWLPPCLDGLIYDA